MGMYDYVDFATPCIRCGKSVTNFQTKDTPFPSLETVDWRTVRRFYSDCTHCGQWHEYVLREKPPTERTIDDYELRKEHGGDVPLGALATAGKHEGGSE